MEHQQNIIHVDINKEMCEAYLQYSMSVIVGRALPDVRDGLKPVHRRILFAMYNLNNAYNKPYKKSARVVGDVIGKYHPHGDKAVYDSIVRLAQDFSLRYPLVDGQGNFGSIDGDSPAAARYTEIRMEKLSSELLEDIEKEVIPFEYNYDDSLLMPKVLPAKFPNLLINGSSGIAVGMATNIPPHNLSEVIDGCLSLIDNPEISIDELMEFIKGPDFPTKSIILNKSGIIAAYKRGRGRINVRSVAEIEEFKESGQKKQRIIVTEIPYQVNKARLIEQVATLVRDKKIEDISDIKDESSKEGIRIVIVLKRSAVAEKVLNNLYRDTQLQTSFNIHLLALNADQVPETFNLKTILSSFVKHRQNVVTKRCLFDLRKYQDRVHILLGLKKALDQIDEIIATIKSSKSTQIAKENLIQNFQFSEVQATAILDMKLQRLTDLERNKIEKEINELQEKILWLQKVLANPQEILDLISEELKTLKEKYNSPRLTKIDNIEEGEFLEEDLIPLENMIIPFTQNGRIKRISPDEYRLQKRGGVGLKGSGTDDDIVTHFFTATTHTTLLIFTNHGKTYRTKVYKLPHGSRITKGFSIKNLIQLEENENTQCILPVDEFKDTESIVMLTQKGIIKKTLAQSFSNINVRGVRAIIIDKGDAIKKVDLLESDSTIFIATKKGQAVHFKSENVKNTGRASRGVKGIKLKKDDEVVSLEIFENNSSSCVLSICKKGYGKRTIISNYRLTGRAGSGIISHKLNEDTGDIVDVKKVSPGDEMMLSTNVGQTIRMSVDDIPIVGRASKGVRVMNLKQNEFIIGVVVLNKEMNQEDSGSIDKLDNLDEASRIPANDSNELTGSNKLTND